MSAIKLPVRADTINGVWWVLDDDGIRICNTGASEYLARAITLTMNCHDALVEAMEPFAACEVLTPRSIPDSESYMWKPSSTGKDMAGISVAHIKAAKAALAKVEKEKANQLLAEAKRYASEL